MLDLASARGHEQAPSGPVSASLAIPAPESSASPAGLLAAALATVLHRYTSQAELGLGVVSGGAEEPHVLQLDLSAGATLAALAARVDEELAAPSGSGPAEIQVVVAVDADPPADTACDLWLAVREAPSELARVAAGRKAGVPVLHRNS